MQRILDMFATNFECQQGSRPSDTSMKIAEALLSLGFELKELGRKHSISGRVPLQQNFFEEIVKGAPKLHIIAPYLQNWYMDGYEEVI